MPVRSTLTLLTLAILSVAAHAQTTQNERKLFDRIMTPDETKAFDPNTATFGARKYSPKSAPKAKEFQFDQRYTPTAYQVKPYAGEKTSWWSRLNFFSKSANTKGKYEVPNINKPADVKTVPVKTAADATRMASVRDLPDGRRRYLGAESKKLDKAVDPTKQPDWRRMMSTGRTMEDTGELKELTIGDIRELLNKNK